MALKNIFKKKKEKAEEKVAKKPAQVKVEKEENKKIKKQKNKSNSKDSKKIKADFPEKYDSIILKPYITEKTAVLAHDNQYVFVVNKRAGQVEIRNAIKAMYGVTPIRVNIQNYYGKTVRFGRVRGKRNTWKKAIVTLPKGSRIDVYEGV